jgi:hypothetical protein
MMTPSTTDPEPGSPFVSAWDDPAIPLSAKRYTPLDPAHGPVIEDLLHRYSAAELVALALELPVDLAASNAIWLRHGGIENESRVYVFVQTVGQGKRTVGELATYLAAAAQSALAGVLLRVEARARANRADLEMITAVLGTAGARGAASLAAALKGHRGVLSLAAWCANAKIASEPAAGGLRVGVLVGHPLRPLLWRLSDYAVSSSSGAVVWLVPRPASPDLSAADPVPGN